ncbi:MAG: hypothetical protein KF852_15135 [Saprospiraceae bacterium]|nr:hypothetical protein [Saprospiraceae bacterium]
MLDKIWQALHDATGMLKDQASTLGHGAREKSQEVIEEWLAVFPRLEAYGFHVNSFSLGVSINPSLEAELRAPHEAFPPERIEEYLKETQTSTALQMVFTTVKSAYTLYRKAKLPLRGELIVRLRIRISPEIRVVIGSPAAAEG